MKIYVADPTKSLKTDSAYRLVPIHSHVIRLGFYEYLEVRRRQGKTQVFDEVPSGEDGEPRRFYTCLLQSGLI